MGGISRDNLVVRVIASQKWPRDSGESIFAARHQDASQGPLGGCKRFGAVITSTVLEGPNLGPVSQGVLDSPPP